MKKAGHGAENGLVAMVCISRLHESANNWSFCYEDDGALPLALEAAREALRIWKLALPPGHKDISDAEELVHRLEQATR